MEDNSQIITIIRNDTNEIYHFQTISSFAGNRNSAITTYPTTEGTPRADNIYANPTTFSVSVTVGGSENISDEWGVGADRPKTAFYSLTYLKDYAIPLSIITPQGEYMNMFLTGISMSNTPQTAYDFSASLTFSELFISKFETITVGPFRNPNDSANDDKKQNNGANNGKTRTQKILYAIFVNPWKLLDKNTYRDD